MRIPVAPYPHCDLMFSGVFHSFLILTLLIGVQLYRLVVLICNFLLNYEVSHLFMCSYAIFLFWFVKCLYKSLGHFQLVFTFLIEHWEFIKCFGLKSFIKDDFFCKRIIVCVFSFHFLNKIFQSAIVFTLSVFTLSHCSFSVMSKKSSDPSLYRVSLLLSSGNFITLGLTFHSMSYFELFLFIKIEVFFSF